MSRYDYHHRCPYDMSGETLEEREERLNSRPRPWDDPRRPIYCPYCYRIVPHPVYPRTDYYCECGAHYFPQDASREAARRDWNRKTSCLKVYKESGMSKKVKAQQKKMKGKLKTYYAVNVRGEWVTGVSPCYGFPHSVSFGKSLGAAIALFDSPPLDHMCRKQTIGEMVNEGSAFIMEIPLPVFSVTSDARLDVLEGRVTDLEHGFRRMSC